MDRTLDKREDRPLDGTTDRPMDRAVEKQELSRVMFPVMLPVQRISLYPVLWIRNSETGSERMPEAYGERQLVEMVSRQPESRESSMLPRELPRIRSKALTTGKPYSSVIEVLQVIYGQDFGAILKNYVDTNQEELYNKGIMRDSLFIRFGGIGKPYIETNYDQPTKAFFLDVVVDCLLYGEHYQEMIWESLRYA